MSREAKAKAKSKAKAKAKGKAKSKARLRRSKVEAPKQEEKAGQAHTPSLPYISHLSNVC